MAGWLDRARRWAGAIKRDVIAVWLAARDARTPLAARLLSAVVAAYALSPIDLIPDFIPVLGLLDDLLLVPLGIALVIRLIPAPLFAQYRDAASQIADRPTSRAGMIVVIVLWLLAMAFAIKLMSDLI